MSRRALSFTLLAIIAVQLLGGIALASECFEPCPDDGDGTTCPPVCVLCTSCTHSQSAIVTGAASDTAPAAEERYLVEPPSAEPLLIAVDIFHVPLFG